MYAVHAKLDAILEKISGNQMETVCMLPLPLANESLAAAFGMKIEVHESTRNETGYHPDIFFLQT